MTITPASSQAASVDRGTADLVTGLVADLAAETSDLAAVLSALKPSAWERDTPAAGWTIRDQVTHLAFFDDATALALTDQPAFAAQRAELTALGDRFPDVIAARNRHLPGSSCLDWFLSSRKALLAAYQQASPRLRLPWYGPDMGLPSSVTARLMETWAHGQDIADALGTRREPTARLRHIANLGAATFAFSFRLRGLPVPGDPVRVELAGPDAGEPVDGGGRPTDSPGSRHWTWGPDDAANRVTGDAEEFCLVVTQRRNVADTSLTVTGPVAARWMAVAQAFAGRASDPRPPGSVPRPEGGRS
jgi:uncharacterized protein (TIGR03084 family)